MIIRNVFLSYRESSPKPSAADGRGQWIDVGPTLKKFLEKHLTISELMTIVNWNNHFFPAGSQRLEPIGARLEAKLHSLFRRGGRRSLADEDGSEDEHVELNPILGTIACCHEYSIIL